MALHPLTIELVPQTAWFSNLRSELSKEWWDKLRKEAYRQAGYQCEICGGRGEKWPVECHEKWAYDDQKKIQTLLGLVALCPSCHRVKHIGLATMQGKLPEAVDHLMLVNDMTEKEAVQCVGDAIAVNTERSRFEWTMDITWLEENYGIELEPKSQSPPEE